MAPAFFRTKAGPCRRRRDGKPTMWFCRGGKAYLIDDPAYVQHAKVAGSLFVKSRSRALPPPDLPLLRRGRNRVRRPAPQARPRCPTGLPPARTGHNAQRQGHAFSWYSCGGVLPARYCTK
ncbi:MAG: hypothetical protein EPN35_12845 [Rhodanobacter sp.]|nr:MAG: hypothetical protein EPN35_12845 [Rhodanobacter sp.]